MSHVCAAIVFRHLADWVRMRFQGLCLGVGKATGTSAQYVSWASRLGEYDRADPIIHHLGDYKNMTQRATTKSL